MGETELKHTELLLKLDIPSARKSTQKLISFLI